MRRNGGMGQRSEAISVWGMACTPRVLQLERRVDLFGAERVKGRDETRSEGGKDGFDGASRVRRWP